MRAGVGPLHPGLPSGYPSVPPALCHLLQVSPGLVLQGGVSQGSVLTLAEGLNVLCWCNQEFVLIQKQMKINH